MLKRSRTSCCKRGEEESDRWQRPNDVRPSANTRAAASVRDVGPGAHLLKCCLQNPGALRAGGSLVVTATERAARLKLAVRGRQPARTACREREM